MNPSSHLIRAALLIGAASVGASAAWAQFPRSNEPVVLSGPDVGFKLTGHELRTGRPTGVWVVRIQGQWVEVSTVPGIRPAQ